MSQKYANGIKYHGFVTIKVLKGNKIVKTINTHNAGTMLLFKLISSVLCGNDESMNMPRYFDFGNMAELAGGSTHFESNLANRIALSSKVIQNFNINVDNATARQAELFNSSYGAFFTILIPAAQILENKDVDVLRLYSSSYGDESLLAEVNLSPALNVNYSGGYNYMVEWVMTFENALTKA